MNVTYILQQIINGLSLGSVYALVAIGYSIVYGILRLINFAHGDILMIGVYAAMFFMVAGHVPLGLAFVLAMLVAALVGMTVERIAYRPLRNATEEATLITSLAVSILIENLSIMTLTAQPRPFNVPESFAFNHEVGGLSFTNMNLFIFVATAVLLGALVVFVTKTKLGVAMRACADNLNAARLMGININIVVASCFALGSALATVAGIMLAAQ